MNSPANTNLDDVCAVIGFSAMVRLIAWFGGQHVYVPDMPTEQHPLCRLIGMPSLRALCREFGNQMLWLPVDPLGQHRFAVEVKRQVAQGLLKGQGTQAIADAVGISQRQVQRIRRELQDLGVLPENPAEKAPFALQPATRPAVARMAEV